VIRMTSSISSSKICRHSSVDSRPVTCWHAMPAAGRSSSGSSNRAERSLRLDEGQQTLTRMVAPPGRGQALPADQAPPLPAGPCHLPAILDRSLTRVCTGCLRTDTSKHKLNTLRYNIHAIFISQK